MDAFVGLWLVWCVVGCFAAFVIGQAAPGSYIRSTPLRFTVILLAGPVLWLTLALIATLDRTDRRKDTSA